MCRAYEEEDILEKGQAEREDSGGESGRSKSAETELY